MDKTRIYLTESLSSKDKHEMKKNNLIAKIIKIIGYLIIIGGFIISGYLAFTNKFDFFKIILTCFGSLITGIFIIGFSKIISLLQAIYNSLDK